MHVVAGVDGQPGWACSARPRVENSPFTSGGTRRASVRVDASGARDRGARAGWCAARRAAPLVGAPCSRHRVALARGPRDARRARACSAHAAWRSRCSAEVRRSSTLAGASSRIGWPPRWATRTSCMRTCSARGGRPRAPCRTGCRSWPASTTRSQWPGRAPTRALREALARVDLFFAHGPAARAEILAAGLPPERMRRGSSPIVARGRGARCRACRRRGSCSRAACIPRRAPICCSTRSARLAEPPATFLLGAGAMEPGAATARGEPRPRRPVRFEGWRDRPERWIAGASVCVVPSRFDAWSQTAALAMSLGVPVVGTAVEGLPAVLGDGRGVHRGTRGPDRAGARDRRRAERAAAHRPARRARRYARGFSPQAVAARYATAYRELCATSAARTAGSRLNSAAHACVRERTSAAVVRQVTRAVSELHGGCCAKPGPSGVVKTIRGWRRTFSRAIAIRSCCCRRACASGCRKGIWRGL